MRLHRLTVTAFGPFAGRQQVDFDALAAGGLFLLRGATGAGKSSVLDAVCYALYGELPGSRRANRMRSDHADPHELTAVTLELTLGGRRLEITRLPEQPRPKKKGTGWTTEKAQTLLREWVADAGQGQPGWQAASRSHQETGEELLRLIGMSREQFYRWCCCRRATSPGSSRRTPPSAPSCSAGSSTPSATAGWSPG